MVDDTVVYAGAAVTHHGDQVEAVTTTAELMLESLRGRSNRSTTLSDNTPDERTRYPAITPVATPIGRRRRTKYLHYIIAV